MARAAHRLGPKDEKNVGGEIRIIHIRICPSVAVCYTAARYSLGSISCAPIVTCQDCPA